MNKKSDKHIKNIIHKVGIDKAPADFTSKVMQDVFISSNEEALKDTILSSLLKRNCIEEPSEEFVSSIMNQVETTAEIKYQPLIGKKTWFIISGIITAFVIFVFFSDSPKESSSLVTKALPYLDQAQHLLMNPFKSIRISPLLTISLLCLTSMLLFDSLLKRKLIR